MATTYTPIVAPRGRMTHALTLADGRHTACNRPAAGYHISTTELNCPRCLKVVGG